MPSGGSVVRWQYNQGISYFLYVQLHKVRSLEPPEGTPSKDLERINRLLEMGGRLLEKHAQQFDIRDFYTTHDAEEGVCQICDELKEIVEGWHMPDAVTIDDAVPKDWVEEDMQLLRKLLEFVLNGVDCDVDDKVRQLWIDAKANHIDKLNCVEVVDPNDLELGVRRAQGAKGAVFEATWRGRLVAVKRPLWEDDMPLEELAEFVREVSWHALLHSHPNIVQLLATTTGGYLVMELADSDLYSLCHGHVKLEFSVNLRLLQQAAAGLNCMHLRNLVHGDVKSRNCLIFTDEQGNPHLKLADLGMTFRVGESRSKTIRKGGGTAAWIAPEVYHSKPIDKASDVYSLGVVMFEVVTGKEPYDAGKQTEFAIMGQKLSGKGPCAVRPQDCPKEMLDLMRRCCAVDPAHRPKMEEVVESLQRMPVDWNESCALKVPPEVSTGSSAADSWVESAANVLTSLSTSSNPSQTTTHLSHTISVRSLPNSPHSADTGSGSFGVERTLSGSDVADRLGTKVLALDGELGLVIDCQLAREGSQVVFKLQLANETKRTVEGVKVVMSANSFGLQPANKEINLPVIPPSSVQTTTNLLVHDRKMLSSGPASDELQVVVETPKSWLVCFTETIHIELLFCEADKIEEEEFRSEWQELGKEREKAEVIPVMVPIGKSVLGTFEAANIGVVVYGRMPGSDWEAMYLRCVLDSLPAQVLLQLYFRRGIEHVDCACRSDKPDLLPMVINAVRRILSSMGELDCAAGAGTSDVDTVDDAVGPSSPDPPACPQDIFNGSLGTPGASQELKTKASKEAILDSGGHTHVGDNERELPPGSLPKSPHGKIRAVHRRQSSQTAWLPQVCAINGHV
ncbi:unnamed protein product [Ostreobium quekettii]|uniref:Protein kinase domain-containing protein n=1 Tax=Ostreobium quekettii TaxID=121088 RepID=A0A8S1J3L2_9CHLO|nr:unnamed protein product [Ostreobium quekettii]